MPNEKVLVSGYYGFNNFGDDAILKVLVDDLRAVYDNPEITVLSANPIVTAGNYSVDSVYRYCFMDVFSRMKESNLFVSGGGSLLQDITSIKSLVYYLALIFLAKVFRVKTCIYAQGIGPIDSMLGRLLTSAVLKNLDLVMVRDEKSHKLLESLGIAAHLTADPVWNLQKEGSDESKDDKIKVGVQLRQWPDLTDKKIETLAMALNDCFSDGNYELELISFQDELDLEVTKKLHAKLAEINPAINAEVVSGLSIFRSVPLISNLDFLIGMRFHACLTTISFNIPTYALSYDPKVTTLAENADIPCTKIADISREELVGKIRDIINNKDEYVIKLSKFTAQKRIEAGQNRELMKKYL